jgi:hypothetical protein
MKKRPGQGGTWKGIRERQVNETVGRRKEIRIRKTQ